MSCLKHIGIFGTIQLSFVILLLLSKQCWLVQACSVSCLCSEVRAKNGSLLGSKVKCNIQSGNRFKFSELKQLPRNTIHLEIFGSLIPTLNTDSFIHLPSLQKLILRNNKIKIIKSLAFASLNHLKKLDLSGNGLKKIEAESFNGLLALENLNLSDNNITRIQNNSFVDLTALKKLELYNNKIICDCHLLWLIEWIHNTSARLKPNNLCSFPIELRGESIKKVTVENLGCVSDWPHHLNKFEINPSAAEVVFEGDQMELSCIILNKEPDVDLVWANDHTSPLAESNISRVINIMSDEGLHVSKVVIQNLLVDHGGSWQCIFTGPEGNLTKEVDLTVITNSTLFCPAIVIADEKGTYSWPETIVNFTVSLPCEIQNSEHSSGDKHNYAYHTCTDLAVWKDVDTDSCLFHSEVTRTLHKLANDQLATSVESLEKLYFLKNYTANLLYAMERIDVHYITEILQKYTKVYHYTKAMGEAIIDVVSLVGNMHEDVLMSSQMTYGSCSKLLNALLVATQEVSEFQKSKNNLAVESFLVKVESFVGLTCNLFDVENLLRFRCYLTNATKVQSGPEVQTLLGSVQIPPTLFYQLHFAGHHINPAHKIQFIGLPDGRLLPYADPEGSKVKSSIVSSVIGVVLDNDTTTMSKFNLTEPLYITLKIHKSSRFHLQPVWWNDEANKGVGGWESDGCQILQSALDIVVYQCSRLGLFSLVDKGSPYHHEQRVAAKFRLSHPAIYFGTAVVLVCLIPSVVLFTIYHKRIEMGKKGKHCLPNAWAALICAASIFCLGVRQTENLLVCQSAGLLLHYFSLCFLLWMLIITWDLYKQLTSTSLDEQAQQVSEDSESEKLPTTKPILKHYLIGWGISMIICGVSGAVLLKKYSHQYWCFLDFQSSCAAVFIPAGVFVFLLYIFFILIRCVLISSDNNGRYSETTQVTDIELLESSANNLTATAVIRDIPSRVSCDSSLDDGIRSPLSLLHSYALVLHLYLFSWISAALSVLESVLPYQEVIFSCLYSFFVSVLAIFILFYYCLTRRDIITLWKNSWASRVCYRKSTVISIQSSIVPTYFNVPKSMQSPSLDKPDSSVTKTVVSPSSKGQAIGTPKVSNLSIDSSRISEPTFYNPQQSSVAKEFFQRQRLKQVIKQDAGDALSWNSGRRNRHKLESTYSSSAPGLFGVARLNNANCAPRQKYIKEMQPLLTPRCHRVLKASSRSRDRFLVENDPFVCLNIDSKLNVNPLENEAANNHSTTSQEIFNTLSRTKYRRSHGSGDKVSNLNRSMFRSDKGLDSECPDLFTSNKFPRTRPRTKNCDKRRKHPSYFPEMNDSRAKSDTIVIKTRRPRRRVRSRDSEVSKTGARRSAGDRIKKAPHGVKPKVHNTVQSSSDFLNTSGESKKKVETSV